jgi:hypothetical protein
MYLGIRLVDLSKLFDEICLLFLTDSVSQMILIIPVQKLLQVSCLVMATLYKVYDCRKQLSLS